MIPQNVMQLAQIIRDSGYEIYLVGGCVRDMVMGIEPHDYDFCTNATPADLQRICREHDLFHTDVGIAFGTVVMYPDSTEGFEVTTYRKETGYSDGRHPDQVAFTDDPMEDLSRRDFTINAMAMDPFTGQIIDPHDGQKDIRDGVLRAVGDADKRMKEDALRIMRGVRFASKYQLEVEPDTKAAMLYHKDSLQNVSKERVTDELRKMFTISAPMSTRLMEFRDVFAVFFPDLESCFDLKQNNKWHKHDVYEHMCAVFDNCNSHEFPVKLAALLHDIGKPQSMTTDDKGFSHFYGHPQISYEICEKLFQEHLALTNEERDTALALIKEHDRVIESSERSIRRAVRDLGPELFEKLLYVKDADAMDHNHLDGYRYSDIDAVRQLWKEMQEQEQCLSLKDLAVKGKDLIECLHMAPGKEIGNMLQVLLEDVINEKCPNDKDALLARASDILNMDVPEKDMEDVVK